jgi:hypothetical protein
VDFTWQSFDLVEETCLFTDPDGTETYFERSSEFIGDDADHTEEGT